MMFARQNSRKVKTNTCVRWPRRDHNTITLYLLTIDFPVTMLGFQRPRESEASNPAAAAYAAAATQQAMMAAAGLAGHSALSVPGANVGGAHASMFGGLAQPAIMAHPGQCNNNEFCYYLYYCATNSSQQHWFYHQSAGMSGLVAIPGMPTALARDASATLYVSMLAHALMQSHKHLDHFVLC